MGSWHESYIVVGYEEEGKKASQHNVIIAPRTMPVFSLTNLELLAAVSRSSSLLPAVLHSEGILEA